MRLPRELDEGGSAISGCSGRGRWHWHLGGFAVSVAIAAFVSAGAHAALKAVVTAATPEAAEAGREILAAGGNAVDAAVAVAMALAVTEPAGSGLGGQAILLVQLPGREPFVINGSSRAPAALPAEVAAKDLVGRRAATIPSQIRVLDFAWREFGSGRVAWSDLLVPATRLAEEGFDSGRFRHASLARYARALRDDEAAASVFLGKDGVLPEAGTRREQPALARTLRRLAKAGAMDFYRGAIADAIASDMQKHGGWISARDLAEFPDPPVRPALRGRYRGYTVWSLPPPAGGWVVIRALDLLEGAASATLALGTAERTLWLAEALRRAHAQRALHPIRNLTDYPEGVARRLREDTLPRELDRLDLERGGETTHFCVVDGAGALVSASLSLNSYFGARVLSPDLGFLYNDYMREFETGNPRHPFALRPQGLPYSSMSATILARDGRPVLALGSPGSRRIISAVVQVVSAWADAELDIEAAIAAPRIHVVPETDTLLAEQRIESRALLRELELRDFRLSVPMSSLFRGDRNPYFGGVHALAVGPDGSWRGAADPRRDGAVRYVEVSRP